MIANSYEKVNVCERLFSIFVQMFIILDFATFVRKFIPFSVKVRYNVRDLASQNTKTCRIMSGTEVAILFSNNL